MKKLLLLLIVSVFCGQAIAQKPQSRLLIEGLVIDKSYKPLIDTRIMIIQKRDTIVTKPKSNGSFKHRFVTGQKSKVIFSLKGYEDFTLNVNTTGSDTSYEYDLTGLMIKMPKSSNKARNKHAIKKAEIYYQQAYDAFVFKVQE